MMRLLSLFLLASVVLTACTPSRKTDWSVTLDADDTRPYGAKLLAASLPHWFGEARIERLSSGFPYDDLEQQLPGQPDKPTVLVLFGLQFFLGSAEWDALQRWASQGNAIVVFAATWDTKLTDYLQVEKAEYGPTETDPLASFAAVELQKQAVWLEADPVHRYTYRGRSLLRSFRHTGSTASEILDSTYLQPHIIGRNSKGITSLQYPIGAGSLTVHAAPLVLSNYFLLQPRNRHYLDGFWQAVVPQPAGVVYWQDYYKRTGQHNGWGVLWRHPATRWALLLLLLTALLYVLFEAKRRQRIIPIVKPPENTSVLFAETVGRLYYSKGDHQNLAEKMVQQTLETIRNRYHLATDALDGSFAKALAQKAALSEAAATEAVQLCEAVRSGTLAVTESDLYRLHQALRPILHAAS